VSFLLMKLLACIRRIALELILEVALCCFILQSEGIVIPLHEEKAIILKTSSIQNERGLSTAFLY